MTHEHHDPEASAESGRSGPNLKLIALLVVVVGLAFFFFQNGERAPVEFLWLDGNWPVWTVIGISVLVGVALDRLVTWQWRRARRRKQVAQG
jgi:uncharacterized integral membrane protein